MEHLILITGSMGAGKTTVLGEASDLLADQGVAHGAIDLDGLGLWHHPHAVDDPLTQNLRCVRDNYAAAGVTRLIVAAAVETRDDLHAIVAATAAQSVVVCRLLAPPEVMESRVAARERGVHSGQYVSRVRVLERILEGSRLEHFSVDADRHVTDVARELLMRAGWIGGGGHDQ